MYEISSGSNPSLNTFNLNNQSQPLSIQPRGAESELQPAIDDAFFEGRFEGNVSELDMLLAVAQTNPVDLVNLKGAQTSEDSGAVSELANQAFVTSTVLNEPFSMPALKVTAAAGLKFQIVGQSESEPGHRLYLLRDQQSLGDDSKSHRLDGSREQARFAPDDLDPDAVSQLLKIEDDAMSLEGSHGSSEATVSKVQTPVRLIDPEVSRQLAIQEVQRAERKLTRSLSFVRHQENLDYIRAKFGLKE